MSDDMPLFFVPYRQEENAKHRWYKDIWAACHNGPSAALLSASALVVYASTLPSASASAPRISTILIHP